MHSTMKAARYYGPGQPLRLEDVPRPRLANGDALLKVRAAGVCHTELHLLDGVLNLGVTPLIPGHEVVGDVVEVRGASAVAPGQRVLLWYYAPCGACAYCRGGAENLCPNTARQFGFTADGGYAEYLVAPLGSLIPLPENLSDAEAVGLACGGATALHAARAIGEVRLGETAVVYGVGGVGFYLIQICRLAGARVIAVGRSPAKLAHARELGADATVDASQEDPLAAIQALTGGQGADVVFDLVASQETLDLAPRALARRGRLVYCGYGADRGSLNPLLLVLREIQLRGAVGNTRSELEETIRLAATGQLRSVVGGTFRLDDANQALAALRSGEIVGRAVLLPGDGDAVASGLTLTLSQRERELTSSPSLSSAGGGFLGPPPLSAPLARGRGGEAAPSPLQPTPGPHPFEAELLAFIARGMAEPSDDREFDALARGLFAYQYTRNEPYRKFCDARGATPETVGHWTEIPAVPIGAFKEVTLACEPVEDAAALFMSSGTTRPEQRSRHYHPSLAVYDASITTNFVAQVLPDAARLPFLVLNPPPAALPNSSLAYYLGVMRDRYGDVGSDFFVTDEGLQHERLVTALVAARREERPIGLLGTTFAFVHFLDRLAAEGEQLRLPDGSRVFDTGGVKGRSREISREELTEAITARLGISADFQVNMYGLTELSTQFVDANLRRRYVGLPPERFKTVPPWARTRVLDPETLDELPPGEVGVLCHTDLGNRASVSTILTEDLGVWRGEGFEILGRVQGSQARGCSIAMDELLSATGVKR